jgi:hypothetical protein
MRGDWPVRGGDGPAHAPPGGYDVRDPNLERVDLFASPMQTVEDSLGVRERAIVAAVEAHEREYLPEQVSGNRRSRHRDR